MANCQVLNFSHSNVKNPFLDKSTLHILPIVDTLPLALCVCV